MSCNYTVLLKPSSITSQMLDHQSQNKHKQLGSCARFITEEDTMFKTTKPSTSTAIDNSFPRISLGQSWDCIIRFEIWAPRKDLIFFWNQLPSVLNFRVKFTPASLQRVEQHNFLKELCYLSFSLQLHQ